MTDRELLGFAAKAGGIVIEWKNDLAYIGAGSYMPQWWNPLADDGDALRLAVKLGFDINHWERQIYAGYRNGAVIEEQYDGSDPYAATRRAIVRSAAAIGKAMQ